MTDEDDDKKRRALAEKFAFANLLIEHAVQYLQATRSPAMAPMGLTIIVHDEQPIPGDVQIAIVTTLPNRSMQRVMLCETLVHSIQREAGPDEEFSVDLLMEVIGRDMREFESTHRAQRCGTCDGRGYLPGPELCPGCQGSGRAASEPEKPNE